MTQQQTMLFISKFVTKHFKPQWCGGKKSVCYCMHGPVKDCMHLLVRQLDMTSVQTHDDVTVTEINVQLAAVIISYLYVNMELKRKKRKKLVTMVMVGLVGCFYFYFGGLSLLYLYYNICSKLILPVIFEYFNFVLYVLLYILCIFLDKDCVKNSFQQSHNKWVFLCIVTVRRCILFCIKNIHLSSLQYCLEPPT